MENNTTNKYIAVAYQLYASGDKTLEFVEQATDEHPFEFISGMGIALPEFEKRVADLEKGAEFDFRLNKDEAYGDRDEERIVELEREVFSINGHFDHENVFVDAVLPLQNADGHRFNGKVLAITDTHVKIDLNHPLAGKELSFKGTVVENREATAEEVQRVINMLSGDECGCSCEECATHAHHEECGCGHCH